MSSFLIFLPTSKTLSLNWNYGSLLGFVYVFQLVSGFFLVFYYSNDVGSAFNSVQYIMFDVNFGWIFRLIHFNGASMFFLFLFLHFFKGLFFFGYRLKEVWFLGLIIFLFLMAVAFMGYVLVWAQMSFWASVVITSLFTVIPIWGFKLVFWIWSGFSVSGATLKFFFALHFLLPWILVFFLIAHLFFLHYYGSTSKIYYCGNMSKTAFFSFYWVKDLYNIFFFFFFFFFFFSYPFLLGDPEMFLEADFLNSPVHIVPEWYFLFAYAILRSIPNKILGVIFLVLSLLIFLLPSLIVSYKTLSGVLNKMMVIFFFFNGLLLSWLGQCLVEPPFVFLGLLSTFMYFFLFFLIVFFLFLTFFVFFVVIMILMFGI